MGDDRRDLGYKQQTMPPSGAVWAHIQALTIRMNDMYELLNNVFLGNTTVRIASFKKISEWIIAKLEQ
ncbi:hypothetical protein HUG20_04520 [Salicibibacter cibi]|uniref:Uncharacterized protein n=1 Tax=Salicibibacter cibi TaxID=2743001 RepID=A0A7T6Z989_9BACI|nr:hypothetical protein [Salicibibacter cibi]QQK79223.1 hypothetical protein HUG20_04520 [Salicibibacter cibi]